MPTFSDAQMDSRGYPINEGKIAKARNVDRVLADINSLASQYQQQARGRLTKEAAMAAALEANPALYAEFRRCHAARVFRYQAGEE